MRPVDVARLVLLAALWGGSFAFMRYLAPVLGAPITADGRLLIGGLSLLLWISFTGGKTEPRRWWRLYTTIGMVNSALPFLLFAWASHYLPAGYTAILNGTTPMFGLLFAAAMLGERITPRAVAGMVVAFAGVAVIVNPARGELSPTLLLAIGACLLAAAGYAFGGVYIRQQQDGPSPSAQAAMSQVFSGLILLPLALANPPQGEVTGLVLLCLAGLGVLSSGIAYMLYFRLLADVGATRALTVTFLNPVFAVLWAALFLGESLTLTMVAGGALVLAGTWMVVSRRAG